MKTALLAALSIFCLSVLLLTTASAGLKPGTAAPDFNLKTADSRTLRSAENPGVKLSDYLGQVVILHFWKSS